MRLFTWFDECDYLFRLFRSCINACISFDYVLSFFMPFIYFAGLFCSLTACILSDYLLRVFISLKQFIHLFRVFMPFLPLVGLCRAATAFDVFNFRFDYLFCLHASFIHFACGSHVLVSFFMSFIRLVHLWRLFTSFISFVYVLCLFSSVHYFLHLLRLFNLFLHFVR